MVLICRAKAVRTKSQKSKDDAEPMHQPATASIRHHDFFIPARKKKKHFLWTVMKGSALAVPSKNRRRRTDEMVKGRTRSDNQEETLPSHRRSHNPRLLVTQAHRLPPSVRKPEVFLLRFFRQIIIPHHGIQPKVIPERLGLLFDACCHLYRSLEVGQRLLLSGCGLTTNNRCC